MTPEERVTLTVQLVFLVVFVALVLLGFFSHVDPTCSTRLPC